MQVIKGKHNIAKVMIDEIDDTTRAQIQDFVNRPMFTQKRIAIMPDCHAGAGSCIGFTMQLGDYIMPQIVGVDIGCGMLAANYGQYSIDPKAFDDNIKDLIPAGHNINQEPFKAISDRWATFSDICGRVGSDERRALQSVGSLGGGNHFIEGDRDESGNLWIVIHSGSRNFGKRIADYYQAEARKLMARFFLDPEPNMEFIPRNDPLAEGYLEAMQMAQHYAHVNRWTMMNRITNYLGRDPESSVESVHNYIDFEDKIIRKGAIRAHKGDFCIIPFNSAEGSALCRGKGVAEWNYSAPHGAGRLMSRTRAFAELDYKEYQARLAEKGVYSSTANSSTLDEAPMAYKPAASILAAIEPTVAVVSMLRPFYNFKAAEGGRRS
jgi:tRNA-splicing ligase RtcB (3'-phosphate/5'-hydroxy nucleic acid ligase)